MPILYGSNQLVFENVYDIPSFRRSELKKHTCEDGQDSRMLGIEKTISAGRFHYVTNITLALIETPYSGHSQWGELSFNLAARSNRHAFPNLKILNIDTTELQLPGRSELDVDGILEHISDLKEVHLWGLEVLPPRIAEVLRRGHSSNTQIMKDNSYIIERDDVGEWKLIAARTQPSRHSTLQALRAMKVLRAQKMSENIQAAEELMAQEMEYDDQAIGALRDQEIEADEQAWRGQELPTQGDEIQMHP